MSSDELKEKCHAIILNHLESKGYPNLTRQGVLNELRPMWIKMEESGLVTELKKHGWTYERYADRAMTVLQDIEIMSSFKAFAEKLNRSNS